jgi:amidohydrolase
MVDIVKTAFEKVFPENHILPQQSSASEDFSFIAQKVPSAYYFVGCGNKEKATDYQLHHPCFAIDEDALSIGVKICTCKAL